MSVLSALVGARTTTCLSIQSQVNSSYMSCVYSAVGKTPVPALRQRYVCFNDILELSCPHIDDQLVFDKARYGRNDTFGAQRCRVPYDSSCELDVQHSLNAECAGKPRCSLAINTAFFNDPCGYDEFLHVYYRCLPGTSHIITPHGGHCDQQLLVVTTSPR